MNKPSLDNIISFYEFNIKATKKVIEEQEALKKKHIDEQLINGAKGHLALCTAVLEALIELQQYRENNKVE